MVNKAAAMADADLGTAPPPGEAPPGDGADLGGDESGGGGTGGKPFDEFSTRRFVKMVVGTANRRTGKGMQEAATFVLGKVPEVGEYVKEVTLDEEESTDFIESWVAFCRSMGWSIDEKWGAPLFTAEWYMRINRAYGRLEKLAAQKPKPEEPKPAETKA